MAAIGFFVPELPLSKGGKSEKKERRAKLPLKRPKVTLKVQAVVVAVEVVPDSSGSALGCSGNKKVKRPFHLHSYASLLAKC